MGSCLPSLLDTLIDIDFCRPHESTFNKKLWQEIMDANNDIFEKILVMSALKKKPVCCSWRNMDFVCYENQVTTKEIFLLNVGEYIGVYPSKEMKRQALESWKHAVISGAFGQQCIKTFNMVEWPYEEPSADNIHELSSISDFSSSNIIKIVRTIRKQLYNEILSFPIQEDSVMKTNSLSYLTQILIEECEIIEPNYYA